MADNTDIKLRRAQIYSVFVRNHTKKGTLKALEDDLQRIKELGTDYIWLLPIYPIGKKDRKGKLGSPYSIKDYRSIDPKTGSWDDFVHFSKKVHDMGMKLMIDIVYNHTSRDSVLLKEHPGWFLRDSMGNLMNKNPDWTDVAELDYSHKDLWKYQIETLKKYADLVDGFRCDVAPQVPLDFWKEARKEVAKVNPDMVWLAETSGGGYIKYLRDRGFCAESDSEMYQAFDMTYDYDVDEIWRKYVNDKIPLARYVEALDQQEYIYPKNYIKMRCLENHDQVRAHKMFINENDMFNWTAFSEFQKGSTLIYAGQEAGMKHTPSLFDKDKIDWKDQKIDLSALMVRMHELSQDEIQYAGNYEIEALDNDVVKVTYTKDDKIRVGLFTLKGQPGRAKVDVRSDQYTNLIDNSLVNVQNGILTIDYDPIIIEGKTR